ncbi:DNA ligase D [Brevundimonas variabilis]|uniref:DNA ligase (ATP) n=1 Tax=Brevundimonas variabilis TaxID=74312 RepID=A0A7W9FHA3_9CAUL|nr:DNA ligase D [Brevundimonas variabilis]MBB5747478.1 bifunctional non-homologous end joining protein LigD [Brevundimonas variabilis]
MRGELTTYTSKRRFDDTPEPRGTRGRRKASQPLRFLVQRHAATRLHYDFRIEFDGVLKSWAVTKAPSRDPSVKRLAVEVEDHPVDYGTFEGTIPEGNYGAGTVQVWDTGTWSPQHPDTLEADFAKGSVKMTLNGERLKGGWALVRLKSDRGKPSKRNNWLLIKEKDDHAVPGEGDALAAIDASVTTGRSMAEITAGAASKPVAKPAGRKSAAKSALAKAVGRASMKPPQFVPIQLCKVADHPPGGNGWVHEIKFDGYRIQIGVGGGRATVRTRSGLDWSDRFPELGAEAADWPDAVVDGELCALDDDGMPDFPALQAAISDGKTSKLIYFAFDLLFEGTEDLRSLPLSHRKARLRAWVDRVGEPDGRLRYVEHFGATGQAVLESACRIDLEGVISKKLDAPYHAGRSSSWVKSKCRGRDEVVIGGWSSDGGTRFRSLLVGVRDKHAKGGLRYLGRVGTGYGEKVTKTLVPALKAVAAEVSPFSGTGAPKGGKDIHWLDPVLVAEVEHGGYTESGSLRQAAFKGLREDKRATEVTEAPQAKTAVASPSPAKPAVGTAFRPGKVIVAGVTISSPDKVLWPAVGDRPAITKADLARYYEAAAERILPHVAHRPTSIIRAPDGITGDTFFQRHAMAGSNPRLKLIDVQARTPYVAAIDVGGLVAIGQSGGLELHPWGCAADQPEVPDQITFDLDPDEGLGFGDVIAAAKVVKVKLEALGLTPFVKTTGGKGLHVVVPIKADSRSRISWDQNKAFAKAVSEAIRVEAPDRFTTTLAKKARGGKIFIDYLRNGRMATAVAPWSPRARPGAGIAYPLSWGQVKAGLDPSAFNLWTYRTLLKKPDPWRDFRASAVSLKPALKKMGL